MKPLGIVLVLVALVVVIASRSPLPVQAVERDGSAVLDSSLTVINQSLSAYRINGVNNPTLTFTRGQTIIFNVNSPGHPFYLKTVRTTGAGNAYNDGVTGNGEEGGPVTWVIPGNAPSPLFYQCSVHSAMGGTINLLDPLDVSGPRAGAVWLGRAAPNPADHGSTITFGLPRAATVDLGVFDERGRRIRSLVRGDRPAGQQSVRWDGQNDAGRLAPSGVYFYRLTVEGRRLNGQLIVTR